MNGLHTADIVVLVVYLLGITALGIWVSRSIRNMNDFFMPRRFGKAMMITHAFGTGTASDQAVTVAAGTFKNGLSGIWWQWVWLPATPFYWLIAPIMRRFRAVTTADVYALRYDASVAVLFAVVGIANLSVKIGLLLKGSSELIHACTDGAINANWAIAIITVLFVTYGAAGGLSAAILTDFFQGILTVVFSFLLLPFVLEAVGGISGIHATIHDERMLTLVSPKKIGVFFIAMYGLQVLVGIVAQPFIMGVCAAGRTEMDGRVGFMVGNILKRICTAAWCLTALAAVAWYMNRGVDLATIKPDHVYGNIARAFLPGIMPGLLGVFIASLLASVMSSCDSVMIASAGLFTKNIYRPLTPDQTEGHYLFVGRIASLFVVACGVVFAFAVPDVISALNIWFKIAPMMAIAFWMGLFWRRGTVAGAWASTLAALGAWWISTHEKVVKFIHELPAAETLRLTWVNPDQTIEIYDPWVIVFYMVAGVAAGVVVSLLTPRVDAKKLDTFYDLTRTPVKLGEVVDEPCTMPVGVERPSRPMLITAFDLEIPVPSATAIAGFVAGSLSVVLLVAGFVWIVR